MTKVNVESDERIPFKVATQIKVNEDQNVRMALHIKDFIAKYTKTSNVDLTIWLKFNDGSKSEARVVNCESQCVNGEFTGSVDLINTESGIITVSSAVLKSVTLTIYSR